MKKRLTEMTLEELWRLFPIFLTPHQPYWKDLYAEELPLLRKILPNAERISHIGSTAVEFISAKPIIDILAELPSDCNLSDYKKPLESAGYICMSESRDRISFNKGYTEDGFAEKVFHLHLRYRGDNDELYFRDFLIEHPDVAKEYESLKMLLAKRYKYNRDEYTRAKSDFVLSCTNKAKKLYSDRYL